MKCGNKAFSWKEREIFLFSGSTWLVFEDNILDFSLIDPFSIFSKPAIDLKIVVFPIPDGPSKQIISPFFFYI